MADVGRPTKYNESYPQMLIEHMAKGFSFESFAGLVGVSKETIYTWTETYSEFLDAKKIAFEKNRMFWENLGIEHILNKSKSEAGIGSENTSLNSTVWIFNMKNRFPKEWRDKQEVDNNVTVNPIGTDADKPDFK